MTLGELHVEIGDQRVDVVVPLNLQAERRGKRQVLRLHCVDVHLLLEGAAFRLCVLLQRQVFKSAMLSIPNRTIPTIKASPR